MLRAARAAHLPHVADTPYVLIQNLDNYRQLRERMQKRSARAQFAMQMNTSDIGRSVAPGHMTLVRSTIEQTKVQSTCANDDAKMEHTITVNMRSDEKPRPAFGATCSAEAPAVKMTSASNTIDLNFESSLMSKVGATSASNTIDLYFESSSIPKVGAAPNLLPELLHTTSLDFSNTMMMQSAKYDAKTHREHTSATKTSCTSSSEVFECDSEDKTEIDWCEDTYAELCSLPDVAGEESEMQIKLHSTDGTTELSVEHKQKHSDEFNEKLELVNKSCTTFFSLTSPTYEVQKNSYLHSICRLANNEVNWNDFLREMIFMFQGINCAQAAQIVNELMMIEDMLAFSTSISFTMLHNDVIDKSAEANNEANTLSKTNTPEKTDQCKRSGHKTPHNLEPEDSFIDSPGWNSGMQSIFSFTPLSREVSPQESFKIYSPPTDHLKVYSPPQDRPAFSASFLLQTQSAKSTACFKFVKNDLKKTAQPEWVDCKFCGKVFKKNGINRHMNSCKHREVQNLHLHNEPKILCVCCKRFFEHDMFQVHYLQCSGQHGI